MEDQKAQQILLEIENKILNEVHLGFDPEVLDVLNNLDASEREIELLKAKIGEEILSRLFGIANSVYYGQLRKGSVDTFYKAVTRLGMDFTRVLIIFLANASLSKDKEVKIIFAKSFATSLIGGRILAKEFGLIDNDAKKVELGGLLLEMGKIIIAIYRSLYHDDYEQAGIDDAFISAHHASLGVKIVEKFKLPDYLKDMISTDCLTLDTKMISLSGIVMLAYSMVDLSFRRFDNRLAIATPMADMEGMAPTIGSVIEDIFKSVGLASYLKIIRRPLPN